MKFILFGAGDIGARALHVIGEKHVECFVDNKKYGTTFQGKKVISFDEMVNEYEDPSVVITASRFALELGRQLENAGIND